MADKQPVFICSDCGKMIYEGNLYFETYHETFCVKCLSKRIKAAVKVEEGDDE